MGGKSFCKGKAQLYRMWYFLFFFFTRRSDGFKRKPLVVTLHSALDDSLSTAGQNSTNRNMTVIT